MRKFPVLPVVAFTAVVVVVAALAWLTYDERSAEACADVNRDVGAAVLADRDGDQDALVNRAIIVRGECEQD